MSNKKTVIVIQNEKEEAISRNEADFAGKQLFIVKVGSEDRPASRKVIEDISSQIKEALASDEKTFVIASSIDISVEKYSI